MRLTSAFLSALAATSAVLAAPRSVTKRQDGGKLVAAHFMLGIVETYDQAAWEAEMRLAASIGIDAFALNIGKDKYNDDQLNYAYAAAEATNFKVFISFDFAYWNAGDVQLVGEYIKRYDSSAGQYKYGGKSFVSSFVGDGFPWRDAEAAAGVSIFACPNSQPGSFQGPHADCGMAWNAAWPNTGNQPINANATTDLDQEYINALGDRPYMAPVSPTFFTHFGPDTYSKNWLFLSDTLYTTRWEQVLALDVEMIELLTWNDFGESHYLSALHPENEHVYAGGPTGAVKWTRDMPHDAWRDVTAAYIKAFKAGQKTASVDADELVYYYRPNPKDAACTDPVGKPTGAEFVADAVFVTAMTTAPGKVVITSGANAPVEIEVPVGISTVSAPMGLGKQTFAFVRDGATLFSGISDLEIKDTCEVNNFNFYVGSVLGGTGTTPAPPTETEQPAPPADTAIPAPPTDTEVPVPPTNTEAPTPPVTEAPAPPSTTEAPAPPAETTGPISAPGPVPAPAPDGERLVFSHFMIGIVSNRNSPADYDDDMKRAKAIGIDAFALNIGVDPYTEAQLELAYQSAENNDMKVFISFDFNWYKDTSDAARIGEMVKRYAAKPAQLMIDGKAFVSSFAGDGLDVPTVRSTAGIDLFMCMNFQKMTTDFSTLDCAFNWIGWDNDGNNKAPKDGQLVTVADGDRAYLEKLAATGGKYMAPVSPAFFTHFGPEVPYSKNWVFPGDSLWYNRWNDILELKPNFIEITTWNDYGESHYIGPLSSTHTDDGGSKWVNDMPHGGWLEMAIPYIKAYKAGSNDVSQFIEEDQLIYWFRRTPKGVNCDDTDTTTGQTADNSTGNYFMGKPDGWEQMDDKVFVVSLLKEAGTVTVNSGDVEYVYEAPAGAAHFTVDMGIGSQSFKLSRSGSEVLSDVALATIEDQCICGIYNFNYFVGVIPQQAEVDALGTISLQMFPNGLKATCAPTPTFGPGAQPPATAAPTSTVTVPGGSAPTAAPTSPPSTDAPPTTATPPTTDAPPTSSDPATPTATSSPTVPTESCGAAPLVGRSEPVKKSRRVFSLFGRIHLDIDE